MAAKFRVSLISLAVVALPILSWSQANDQPRPPRTFPEFAGAWQLDEAASTGRLKMAPPVPRTLAIATSPEAITVTKVFRFDPELPGREGKRTSTETPPPEVYRFDGTDTVVPDDRLRIEHRYSFLLVADALALTVKNVVTNGPGNTTLVTDAYSVNGDVLTLHRQLSTILLPAGHIATMQEPANNFRQTYVYRRAAK